MIAGRRPRLALASLLLATAACRVDPPPAIPQPDLAGAEAEVVRAVERAIAEVREAPRSAQAWGQLADRYRAGQWLAAAAGCYEQAEQLEPGTFRWPYLLAQVSLHTDPEAAAAALSRAIRLDPDYVPARLAHAGLLTRLGQGEEARRELEQALRLEPTSAHAHTGLGQLALSAGDPQSALEHLTRAVELDPLQGEARRALAQVYFALGDEPRAAEQSRLGAGLPYRTPLADPRAVASVAPVGSVAHAEAGRSLMQQGMWQPAAEEFRAALAADPRSVVAHHGLTLLLIQMQDLDGAERQLAELARIQPDAASLPAARAELLAARGDLAGAVAAWQKSVELAPGDAQVHYALGDALLTSGRREEAEQHLRQSLELDARNARVAFALGALLGDDGRTTEAEALLERAVALDPQATDVRFYLGTLLAREGRAADAEVVLAEVVARSPGDARARANLGTALVKQQKFAQALPHLREALRLDPRLAPAQVGLAACLFEQGDVRGAIAAYRDAIRSFPDWALPLQRLALILAADPDPAIRDGEEAVRLAERAVALIGRHDAEALDTLAAAYAESGRFDEATATAERAGSGRAQGYRAKRPFRLAPRDTRP